MSQFAIVSEQTETTVTKKRLRSPCIQFSHNTAGDQFVSIELVETIEINGVSTSENPVDRVTINPLELEGIPLLHPITGEPIVINGNPELISTQYVLAVLFTIFKIAAQRKGYV